MVGHAEDLVEKMQNGKMLTDGNYVYMMSSTECLDGTDAYVVHVYTMPVNIYETKPSMIIMLYDWCNQVQGSNMELEDFKEWIKPLTVSDAAERLQEDGRVLIGQHTKDKYFKQSIPLPGGGSKDMVFSYSKSGLIEMECSLRAFQDLFGDEAFIDTGEKV